MKKEDKELLIKDLSARLPYGVILKIVNEDSAIAYGTLVGMTRLQKHPFIIYEDLVCIEGVLTPFRLEDVKPYLRSIDSMTDKERHELNNACDGIDYALSPDILKLYAYSDWLNAHHFDYRGLIGKGLAIEAPEGMYN